MQSAANSGPQMPLDSTAPPPTFAQQNNLTNVKHNIRVNTAMQS